MDFKTEIIKILSQETKLKEEELAKLVSIPPDPKLGNYAFPCFKLGKNPLDEAERLKEKLAGKLTERLSLTEKSTGQLKLPCFISKVEAAGPYLNFFIDNSSLAEEALKKIYREARKYGAVKSFKGRKIVIEFCGPNTNKPLHLGHLRNMALGSALQNILSFQGNKVHPVNIINDRGIHICQSMLAYKKWGGNKEPDKKGDHFVGDFYVLFSKKAKDNEELKLEAQQQLLKWERGDKETRELWRRMNSWVLQGFNQTYKRFGIGFEKEYAESSYFEKGKEIVDEGLKKKVFEKDVAGAVIAPLEKFGLPNKVLLRPDGTSVYITQDIYLVGLRYRDFKFNKLIYVVASEQQNHFKQLFKILELLGRSYAKDLYHLAYGMVHLSSGRMKSREGTVVDADDLMDEISQLAEQEVKKRHESISEKEAKERAEFISLAAIKFYMLKTDPFKDIVYNPEESLSFEGETGPYLQYTHARACSILRKAGKGVVSEVNFKTYSSEEELAVIRALYAFPEIVAAAAESYKPHIIAQYLISLAQAFNEFYHQCPVLSEQKNILKARLLLVDSVRQVLETGLNLLGIRALEEM